MNAGGRLPGKVCLVSDARGAFGAALCEALVAQGAKVVLGAGPDAVETTSSALVIRRQEIGSEPSWRQLAACAESQFGRLDVLVNANWMEDGGTLDGLDTEQARRVTQTMIETAAVACRELIPVIQAGGGEGAVITFAPTDNLTGSPGDLMHSVANGAIRALTRSLAIHCFTKRYSIRCNAIEIGKRPDGSLCATAAEIAAAVIYLASAESGYMNGHALTLDGGPGHPGHP